MSSQGTVRDEPHGHTLTEVPMAQLIYWLTTPVVSLNLLKNHGAKKTETQFQKPQIQKVIGQIPAKEHEIAKAVPILPLSSCRTPGQTFTKQIMAWGKKAILNKFMDDKVSRR